jgi:2-C-methyl-D-erythritol 4-phosphate cytidylyltransferase
MRNALNWCAVIVSAGRGTRFGRPKQLIEIAGAPMLSWSIRAFQAIPEICDIVVVTEREWLEEVAAVATGCSVVAGGATRQASVYEGLRAVPSRCNAVLVHDGARPLITVEDVRRGMERVAPGRASLLGIPVVDTIKTVDPATNVVRQTLDRNLLWAAQTPQFAMLEDLRNAHEAGIRDGADATDDAMLLERIGVQVLMVHGSPENFKVTLPEDHTRAQHAMRERLAAREEVR